MFREWISHSLQRRLLVSLLLAVGLTLAVFQLTVDQLVDHYIVRSLDARGIELQERNELLRDVDFILLGGMLTVLTTGALAIVLAVRRGLRPLERVAAAAQEISVDRAAHALPLAGVPAEIRTLGERFNQLIERLTEALEHERRFSADLAHELRTPLAEIRTLGEAGLGRQDVASLHEFLRQTTAAAVGMQGVIESLLAVARADRVALGHSLEPLDLLAAVQARIERLRITDPEGSARLQCRIPSGLWIQSDAKLLDAVLLNVLVNALQHGAAGTPVEIDWIAAAGGRGGALRIRNSAPQLSAASLNVLVERFTVQPSSGRDVGNSGAGLGLWIVARLCTVLGMRLDLSLDAEQRLNVELAGLQPL